MVQGADGGDGSTPPSFNWHPVFSADARTGMSAGVYGWGATEDPVTHPTEPHKEAKRSFLNIFADQELRWDEYWFRSHDISMSGFCSRSVFLEKIQVQPRFKLICCFFFFFPGKKLWFVSSSGLGPAQRLAEQHGWCRSGLDSVSF